MDFKSSSTFKNCVRCLGSAAHVVILTGAGCSAESGINTFRDPEVIINDSTNLYCEIVVDF